MSVPRIIKRFAISDSPIDLAGSGVSSHWRKWGGIYFTRLHADEESMLDLGQRQDLVGFHNMQLLSDLSTPASKLPPRVLNFLTVLGITPAPDDTLLNVLRAVRDRFESNSPNPFGFDISP